MKSIESFNEIWSVDFEFVSRAGEVPNPVICLVAKELISGETKKMWLVENPPHKPPYSMGEDSLFVAYAATAEMSCHLQLGWDIPTNILDLYVEFLNHTNGLPVPSGKDLLGALIYFGIPGITKEEKERMRGCILKGEPYSSEDQREILDYCLSDVVAGERLFHSMENGIDLPRALLRGRYMAAIGQIERNGIPLDVETHKRLIQHWEPIKSSLVRDVDRQFGVFDGLTFKLDRWEKWLTERDINWPRTKTGRLSLDDETFADMVKIYPEIIPIHELRYILGKLRLSQLLIGHDGRNRCYPWPFKTLTGRNAPSTSEYIFALAVWLRSLIKPQPGSGIAYIDYSQQEFGVAAALSEDAAMQDAYLSGDPYITFAKQAHAVPENATKQTHPRERELFKQCTLAVQYGMGARRLATSIREPIPVAQNLLNLHRRTYARFWNWSDSVMDYAFIHNRIWTRFGWYYRPNEKSKVGTIRNFLMQANGAEILRLACCMVLDTGVKVCAPVHDAILIEAPIDELASAITTTQKEMGEASKIVLDGFGLRTDAERWDYPDRYSDRRGTEMWNRVMTLLERCENG